MTSNNTVANMLRSHAESLRSGRGVLSSMSTDERLDRAADEIERLEAKTVRLKKALSDIAYTSPYDAKGESKTMETWLREQVDYQYEIASQALKESEG